MRLLLHRVQVYKGKLRPELGGKEVAVKIQRPGVLESVALDLFIMRRASIVFSQLPGMSAQWSELLDDWALRFFQVRWGWAVDLPVK